MLGGKGELAGDQQGAAAMTILDDLHQIAALAGGEAIRSPIVEDEEIDPDASGTAAQSGRRRGRDRDQ